MVRSNDKSREGNKALRKKSIINGLIVFFLGSAIVYFYDDPESKAHSLAEQNEYKQLEILLTEKGVDPNSKIRQVSLLSRAIRSNSLESVRILLKYGVDLDEIDFPRKTRRESYVQYALFLNHNEIAKELALGGADLNHKNVLGENVLWYCCDDYELFSWFLDRGSNLFCTDTTGRSVIYKIFRNCNLELFDYILSIEPEFVLSSIKKEEWIKPLSPDTSCQVIVEKIRDILDEK